MKKDSNKTKEQLIAELAELRKESKAQEEKLKDANHQLDAHNQQLWATDQQLRAANQQLTASEATFKSYIHNAPDGIFIANEKGKYIEVNKAACNITGYSEDELLHLTILELIQEEYSEKAKNHFQTIIKEGFARDELGFVTKLGEKRFWSVDAVKLSETRILGFVKDITERKQAEKALRESEEKFRKAFSTSPDSININRLDDGMFISINDGFTKITGYSESDVIGKTSPEINIWLNPRDREKLVEGLRKHGHLQNLEAQFRMKDGKVIYGVVSAALITLDGTPHIISITRDITDRKQAEEALKESELRLKSLINATPDIICFKDGKGRWLVANDADLELFSLQNTDYFGKTDAELAELTHPIYKESFFSCMESDQKAWQSKTLSRNNEVIPTINGTKKVYDVIKVPVFEPDGARKGLVVLGRDITKRKLAEEALKENEEKYRKIFENSPSGILMIDENGMAREANAAISKITGYSIDELIGSNVKKLTLPENKNLVNQNIKRIISGELLEQEVISYRKDGSQCTLMLRETSIKFPNGKTGILSMSDDITKQKIAEASLKDSENKYRELSTLLRLMADNMSDMLWAKNLNNEYIFVNKAMCTGLLNAKDTDEPLEKTDMFFATRERNAYPDNPEWHTFGELCRDTDTETLEAKKPMHFDEFGNVRGKFLFLDVHKAPIYDNNGKLIGTVGSARDVTVAKEAENQLLKLSTAVTQSPSVITITDTEGKLEYVNPKFTEITRYSLEEAIGQNSRILKSGEHSDEMYRALWETITSGKIWQGEFHNKKKNGELFWESASISPIFDEQGNIINYIKVAEDITQRKQAEDNFRHSIDESPLGIRIVNQAGEISYVNKAFLDIYEFSSLNEFNQTKTIDRYTAKSYQEHQERKKIRQEGRDISNYEVSIRRKNGEIRHIEVWRKEVIWNGEKHFQVINKDITELKRLNTDLILAKEKAEESDRLKSAFLANMSHEIRTPMNAILGFTGLLKEPQLSGEEKDEYIRIIEKGGNRLLNTINDIIDISKIEAGQVKVVKSEMSINKLLEEEYNFFYNEAKSKGLELNYTPSLTDRESRMITDKHKLEGIMTNLIKNAIKYTERGEIAFGCRLKAKEDKAFIEFYVKDTGIGIPADRVEAIFNRFEQADIEDKRVFEGSGLGLAISKSYAEMLDGEIGVSSIEDSGSTFTFSLPYNRQNLKENSATQNNENKEDSGERVNNLSIIVAEDDEISQLFYKTIFKNKFKKTIYTTTGKETIEKFRENPDTDIILMDIKMSDMNGYDATREIRKFNSDVVIIAQTAFGLAGDREKALEAGCNNYISKPVKKEILFKKIQACLDKKRN